MQNYSSLKFALICGSLAITCTLGYFLIKQRFEETENTNATTTRVYIPIPQVDLIRFFKQTCERDVIKYLNTIAKNIDSLYKIYIDYKLKNNKSTIQKSQLFQTLIRPIMIKLKFDLAKLLYEQDAQDVIESLRYEIEILQRQIFEIQQRLPPHLPFMVRHRYAPYFWIITADDYNRMNPLLRDVLREGVSEDRFRSVEHDFIAWTNLRDVRERMNVLLERFIEIQALKYKQKEPANLRNKYESLAYHVDVSKMEKDEQMEYFSDWCFEHLRIRLQEGQKMVDKIRKDIRKLQRERSKRTFEWNKLKRLKLEYKPLEIRR